MNRKAWPTTRRGAAGARHARLPAPAAVVVNGGRTTHVLLTMEEYEQLVRASELAELEAKLDSPRTQWMDWEDAKVRLAASRIARARKAAGLTQTELAQRLGVPQAQISRIERQPERTTVRTLRRVAQALGVSITRLLA